MMTTLCERYDRSTDSSGVLAASDSRDAADLPVARVDVEGAMDQIGEYIVHRLVGEGGMGKVYEAEERLSKRRVALKVLRDELSKSERARALFLNEMQILAHLEHPHIVRSLASIEADGKLVTVLEYLDGSTLRQVLAARSRLDWEQACHVVMCVAQALVAAHGQQPPVIHRDLKPENIMVLAGDDKPSIKVMDFGIAKLVQELNQTNTQSVGTLQYMSPEQIDAHTVDHRSDLYCLGLVFYELLSGRPPFASASPRQLLNMQCTDPPPPFDDDVVISRGVEQLVFELLQKDPAERPQSAAEVVARLEPFLTSRTLSADKLGAPATAQNRASRVNHSRADHSRADHSRANHSRADHAEGDDRPARNGRPQGAGAATLLSPTPRSSDDEPRSPTSQRQRAPEAPQKDTVAIIEAASKETELSPGLSLAIIVFFALLAAVGTYLYRASQDAAPAPAPARGSSSLLPGATQIDTEWA